MSRGRYAESTPNDTHTVNRKCLSASSEPRCTDQRKKLRTDRGVHLAPTTESASHRPAILRECELLHAGAAARALCSRRRTRPRPHDGGAPAAAGDQRAAAASSNARFDHRLSQQRLWPRTSAIRWGSPTGPRQAGDRDGRMGGDGVRIRGGRHRHTAAAAGQSEAATLPAATRTLAFINRFGFNSAGADAVAEHLEQMGSRT